MSSASYAASCYPAFARSGRIVSGGEMSTASDWIRREAFSCGSAVANYQPLQLSGGVERPHCSTPGSGVAGGERTPRPGEYAVTVRKGLANFAVCDW